MRADDRTEEPSDEALVSQVGAGDEDALVLLYHRYVGPIYRFIQAQVRDRDEAEDLTSETFARMMRGLRAFRGEASFKNWLYQIARNAVRNHRRALGYRRQVPLGTQISADPPAAEPGESAAARQAAEAVLALLRPLPPRYRQVLELRFLDGLSIEETALRMGVSPANAKVLQHRALKKAALMVEEQAIERG